MRRYSGAGNWFCRESDGRLAADCISTVYSAYLSAERKGAEVPVRAY